MNILAVKSKEQAPCLMRGFTLVEVLVVIAIVTLLAGLLLAVMTRAKENGRRNVCQGQLKQLALALQQYVQDSDGRYPDGGYQSQLFPYIKSLRLIECPTHQAGSLPFPDTPSRSFYIWGYWYNGVQLNTKTKVRSSISFSGQSEASILNSSTTWSFGDDRTYDDPTTGGGGFLAYTQCGMGGGFWPTLHSGGANYAFLDGHVKWLTPQAIDKLACST